MITEETSNKIRFSGVVTLAELIALSTTSLFLNANTGNYEFSFLSNLLFAPNTDLTQLKGVVFNLVDNTTMEVDSTNVAFDVTDVGLIISGTRSTSNRHISQSTSGIIINFSRVNVYNQATGTVIFALGSIEDCNFIRGVGAGSGFNGIFLTGTGVTSGLIAEDIERIGSLSSTNTSKNLVLVTNRLGSSLFTVGPKILQYYGSHLAIIDTELRYSEHIATTVIATAEYLDYYLGSVSPTVQYTLIMGSNNTAFRYAFKNFHRTIEILRGGNKNLSFSGGSAGKVFVTDSRGGTLAVRRSAFNQQFTNFFSDNIIYTLGVTERVNLGVFFSQVTAPSTFANGSRVTDVSQVTVTAITNQTIHFRKYGKINLAITFVDGVDLIRSVGSERDEVYQNYETLNDPSVTESDINVTRAYTTLDTPAKAGNYLSYFMQLSTTINSLLPAPYRVEGNNLIPLTDMIVVSTGTTIISYDSVNNRYTVKLGGSFSGSITNINHTVTLPTNFILAGGLKTNEYNASVEFIVPQGYTTLSIFSSEARARASSTTEAHNDHSAISILSGYDFFFSITSLGNEEIWIKLQGNNQTTIYRSLVLHNTVKEDRFDLRQDALLLSGGSGGGGGGISSEQYNTIIGLFDRLLIDDKFDEIAGTPIIFGDFNSDPGYVSTARVNNEFLRLTRVAGSLDSGHGVLSLALLGADRFTVGGLNGANRITLVLRDDTEVEQNVRIWVRLLYSAGGGHVDEPEQQVSSPFIFKQVKLKANRDLQTVDFEFHGITTARSIRQIEIRFTGMMEGEEVVFERFIPYTLVPKNEGLIKLIYDLLKGFGQPKII